jgi:hypothetical protein
MGHGREMRPKLPAKGRPNANLLMSAHPTMVSVHLCRPSLEKHRDALEARTYLIEAGRKWYELWVPQNPAAWALPKLVFPDISDKPIFWIDTDGGVVNGECYWLQCENKDEHDLLWLALAVANSTFIEAFYDHRFNNKLYAGRRRYITQYVELFPLPNPTCVESVMIIALGKVCINER